MKKLLLSLGALLFISGYLLAQRTITGTLTDGTDPLIGASVLIKGTSTGTVTDFDGMYTLEVPDGSTALVFSYTGFSTQEVDLGASNIMDVVLSEGVLLETAVVTALGIQREEKALGYAVQQVDGSDITRSGAANPVDALVGKASGIQVTRSSGSAGGGSRILIRGVTSM